MTIGEITKFLDTQAPLSLQESYDNAGLLLGDPTQEISGVLLCLDITPAIIAEAIHHDIKLIISHHPLIFKPLKRLSTNTLVEQVLLEAVRANIGIYAIHTNLDNLQEGVSMALGKALQLDKLSVLRPLDNTLRKLITFCPPSHAPKVREAIFNAGAGHIGRYDSCSFNVLGTGTFRGLEGTNPYVGQAGELHKESEERIETVFPVWLQNAIIAALCQSHPYEEVAYDIYPLANQSSNLGSGLIGELPEPLDVETFLRQVKSILGIPMIRHTQLPGKQIKKVALCGGSGSFLIKNAREAKADIFLTADLKYHDFFESGEEMILADIGHFESEQFTLALLKDWLSIKFPNFAARITSVITNPIHYL